MLLPLNFTSAVLLTLLIVVLLPTSDTFFLHLQVCLDGKATTEKELDTVEVLKAIQKAKEVKDRMSNNDKKVRPVTPNPGTGGRVRAVKPRSCD